MPRSSLYSLYSTLKPYHVKGHFGLEEDLPMHASQVPPLLEIILWTKGARKHHTSPSPWYRKVLGCHDFLVLPCRPLLYSWASRAMCAEGAPAAGCVLWDSAQLDRRSDRAVLCRRDQSEIKSSRAGLWRELEVGRYRINSRAVIRYGYVLPGPGQLEICPEVVVLNKVVVALSRAEQRAT